MPDATTELRQLLGRQEQTWGTDHPKVAITLAVLADMACAEKRYIEAEALYWRVLEIKHKHTGQSNIEVAATLHDLAALQECQNNLPESERLLRWSLDIKRNLLGAGHPEYAKTIDHLNRVLEAQGKEPHVDEHAPQSPPPATAVARADSFDWEEHFQRGTALLDGGRYEAAEELFACLVDVTSYFAPQTIHHARSLDNLGRALFQQGNYEDALDCLKDALAIFEKTVGFKHRDTVECLEAMADVHAAQDELDPAKFLYSWALGVARQESFNEPADRIGSKLEILPYNTVQKGSAENESDAEEKQSDESAGQGTDQAEIKGTEESKDATADRSDDSSQESATARTPEPAAEVTAPFPGGLNALLEGLSPVAHRNNAPAGKPAEPPAEEIEPEKAPLALPREVAPGTPSSKAGPQAGERKDEKPEDSPAGSPHLSLPDPAKGDPTGSESSDSQGKATPPQAGATPEPSGVEPGQSAAPEQSSVEGGLDSLLEGLQQAWTSPLSAASKTELPDKPPKPLPRPGENLDSLLETLAGPKTGEARAVSLSACQPAAAEPPGSKGSIPQEVAGGIDALLSELVESRDKLPGSSDLGKPPHSETLDRMLQAMGLPESARQAESPEQAAGEEAPRKSLEEHQRPTKKTTSTIVKPHLSHPGLEPVGENVESMQAEMNLFDPVTGAPKEISIKPPPQPAYRAGQVEGSRPASTWQKLQAEGRSRRPTFKPWQRSAASAQTFAQEPDQVAQPRQESQGPHYMEIFEDKLSTFLWDKYRNSGARFVQQRNYQEGERMYMLALEKAQGFGPRDPRLWQTQCALAAIYESETRFDEAERLYRASLEQCEQTVGQEHPETARHLHNLAKLYSTQNRWTEAERCYEKALQIMRTTDATEEIASLKRGLDQVQRRSL